VHFRRFFCEKAANCCADLRPSAAPTRTRSRSAQTSRERRATTPCCGVPNALFGAIQYKKQSICQDRLGTSVGKVEGKGGFCRLNPGEVGLAIDNDAAFVIEGDTWRVVSGGGKVHRKVFDNGVLRKTELRPSEQLQPLAELLELPDFLSLR
jgi:hypothetical protein